MLRAFPFALLLASCATATSTSTESFSFRSRDWMNPSLQDLTATVQVKRIGPQLYATHYVFDLPLDPLRGTNPTSFHIFAFCVAAKLAAQTQRQYWSVGTTTPGLKYSQTREVVLLVASGASNTDRPSTNADSRAISWLAPASDTASMRATCERVLRAEHMWPK